MTPWIFRKDWLQISIEYHNSSNRRIIYLEYEVWSMNFNSDCRWYKEDVMFIIKVLCYGLRIEGQNEESSHPRVVLVVVGTKMAI